MNLIAIGGRDPRTRSRAAGPTAISRRSAAARAGGRWGPGDDGIQCNMTNTMNTPVEALEITYPLRVERYELREGSAGDGQHRGGNGLVRAIRILDHEARVSLQCERRRFAPYGLHGGADGKPGRNCRAARRRQRRGGARQGHLDARRRRGRDRRDPGRRRLGQNIESKPMSETAIKRMMLEEFLGWDDGTDTRYELVGGFPVAMAPSLEEHGVLSNRLGGASRKRTGRPLALPCTRGSRNPSPGSCRYFFHCGSRGYMRAL